MECLDLLVRYASLNGPNRRRAMQEDLSALRTRFHVVQDSALQEDTQAKRLIHCTVPSEELRVAAIESDGILLAGSLPDAWEGELCMIITSDERLYTGTLRTGDAGLGVRLDETVSTVEDIKKLGIQLGDWVEIDPQVHVTQSRFIKARNLRTISRFVLLICALEMLLEDGRALAKGTAFCLHFDGGKTGHHACWGIPEGTCCSEDFEESLRIEALAITAENGLDEYSVAIQGEWLERMANGEHIPYKAISGIGKGNILAAAFQVDGLSERGHEKGIKAAIKLLSTYLSE